MSMLRLVRVDEYGLYVRTGGYTFRPADVHLEYFSGSGPESALAFMEAFNPPIFPSAYSKKAEIVVDLQSVVDEVYAQAAAGDSSVVAGTKVRAVHVGGTQTARVAGELWVSSYEDPQAL